ncbi:MAG: GDP-L-fucose synthase [Bacteroidia bacterium]|nr:GDP-L-fucose synthase [Bacteroidia bacterium]
MNSFRKIAVTGASGHLGNTVCRMLLEQGFSVNALYNSDNAALKNLNVKLFQGSVLDTEAITGLLKGCDAVIHCAAIISIHGDPTGIVHKTNTEGAKNVAETSKNLGVKKIIHVSSVHAVLEEPFDLPFDETRPHKQQGSYAYDYSKARGEQLVFETTKNSETEAVVVRPSLIIGPYDFKPSEIGKALLDFFHGKIPALTAGGYNYIDVRDVAKSVVAALGRGRNKEVYHLTGNYYTVKDLAETVKKVTGKKVPETVLPFWFLKTTLPFIKLQSKLTGAAPVFTKEALDALKYGHKNMVSTKAQKQLGHSFRPLEESVADYYEWMKTRNVIQ